MTLLTGFVQGTEQIAFRVYAADVPQTERKRQSRLSHFTAYDLLGAALCEDFFCKHVMIKRRGLEKPQLVRPALHMSISHCKGLAVCAVGIMPLGIDCEVPRKISERLTKTACTEQERCWIENQKNTDTSFLKIWTLKEAYTKYTGEGIRHPFSTLEFSLENGIRLVYPEEEQLLLYQLVSANDTVISLCVPAAKYDISCTAEKWTLTSAT